MEVQRALAANQESTRDSPPRASAHSLAETQMQEVVQQVVEKIGIANNEVEVVKEDQELGEPGFDENLGVHLTNNTKSKIINGEYVELNSLLPSYDQNSDDKHLVLVDGHIQIKNKKTRSIGDIKVWTDAFLIFTSIYSSVHTDEIQGLLKYIHTVRLAASRVNNLGWLRYDEQFRYKKARNPMIPWGKVDQELWLLYVYNCNNLQPVHGSCIQARKCYDFNYRGACGKASCQYAHLCMKCSKQHPSKFCKQIDKTNGFNRTKASSSIYRPGTQTSAVNRSGFTSGKVTN